MTFSVNGIKQEKDNKYTVEILVCTEAPLLTRKILEKANILILSLKQFAEPASTFGDVYFTIRLNFQEIIIVTKYTDIQQAANFFTLIGFDIIAINSYAHPIGQQEVDNVVTTAKADIVAKKAKVQEDIQKIEEQEKNVYRDARLQSAKKIIERIFEKIDEALKRSAGTISVQEIKALNSLTEDLKKLRMGTNLEKIREIIQEIFKKINIINDQRYTSIQATSTPISPDSSVTNVDLDRELERLENVRILKSLGAHISVKNQDYAIMGSLAIFWKFLQKDLLAAFSNAGKLLYNLYDIAEFMLVIIVSLLGIYTIANESYLFSQNAYGLAYSLITMGLRGLIVFGANYGKTKNISRLLLLLGLVFLVHYLIMRSVTSNFAL